jgi:RNase P/RNase MRP subunit POP5
MPSRTGDVRPHAIRATTLTLAPQFVYMRITLETASEASSGFASKVVLDEVVSRALLEAYGIAGSAALCVETIEFDAATGAGILKVSASVIQSVWAALTLVSKAGGVPARIIVSHSSPFLLAIGRRQHDTSLTMGWSLAPPF